MLPYWNSAPKYEGHEGRIRVCVNTSIFLRVKFCQSCGLRLAGNPFMCCSQVSFEGLG